MPLPDVTRQRVAFLVQTILGSELNIAQLLTHYTASSVTETSIRSVDVRLTGRIEVLDPGLPRNRNDALRLVLRILWTSITKPVLDALNLKPSSTPPRLWWCPTGALAFLPILAAGIYDELNTDCVSDYVVSSYTPTLTGLLSDDQSATASSFKMTAVIQPDSEISYLPATREELKVIRERVPKEWLVALGDSEQATSDTALFHLRNSSIVHFACHGVQDIRYPLNSGLVLTDGRLKVSQLMRKPDTDSNTGPRLAFLSTCETARGDENVPDEALHLAATLLFAGFQGVSCRTMNDLDGPQIADAFYEHLFKNCDASSQPSILPDLTRAAEALHVAVLKLRAKPNIPFSRWVPFVHYGL
ncbi:CHAT domain-containing protein [Mycena epipterygia]|nr:CHAT domain-containing protein [Mycena epipterygia]